MSLQDRIINHFSDSIQTQQETLSALCELIEYAAQRLVATLLTDRKILSCGNGRSAACVQLFSAALLNQYERDRPALPVFALSTDNVTLTGIANDHHFDEIFAKQLRALGQSGDILLVYINGNHAANIIKAIAVAHEKNMSVIALTGDNGNLISALLKETDIEMRVPSASGARTQELHTLITHCLCDLIDHEIFG